MKMWRAIIFTLELVALGYALNLVIPYGSFLVVIITSSWAASESRKLGFSKYKTPFDYNPTLIFILMCLIWIIEFPWYLSERYKIMAGITPLKLINQDPNSVIMNNINKMKT